MPSITFINSDGSTQVAQVTTGTTVMQAARDNDIDAIVGECGGACACATCHCYVDAAWLDKIAPADANETGMLDCVVDPQPNSRLGCQIPITDALDGLVIRLPASQY